MASKCCGFSALRCWLVILNVFYIAISLFLIGLVIAARTLAYHFTGITIVIGIAVAAALLFAVAVVGLIGTLRHNQVVLFFYMIVMGVTGVVLFSVSVAALAIPKILGEEIFLAGWKSLSYKQKGYLQDSLNCCGFDNGTTSYFYIHENSSCHQGHPPCYNNTATGTTVKCCESYNNELVTNYTVDKVCKIDVRPKPQTQCPDCSPCHFPWEKATKSGVLAVGAFGMIFSFTQVIGIVLTFYYRNQKDPAANPSAFL